MPEFLTLKEAVAAHLEDGMMAAFEGFTHLMPYAAAHEVIRQAKARPDGGPYDPGCHL